MKRSLGIFAALLGSALVLSACASDEYRWVQEGASENKLRSDIFWCTRVQRQQYYEHNVPNPEGTRDTQRYIDASCMRERGWRRERVN